MAKAKQAAKTKQDRMGKSLYASMKKHPIIKNPIVLFYLAGFAVLIVGYILYAIYSNNR